MNSSMVAVFGGIIAVVLLLLLGGSTFYMVNTIITQCSAAAECKPPPLSDGLVYVVTTVGGLVSALVIAQLSVTEPGKAPTIGTFTPTSWGGVITTNTVIALYLAGWVAIGLSALVVGVMIYPKVNSTLSDMGTTWLGLAVSAAYAYFGINPGARGSAQESGAALAPDAMAPGQKIPDATEVATCGPISKKIRRTDPEFGALLSNANPDINFKDEENTGADRMMTPRLQDRLDKLAAMVKAEWPNHRLRVTEAWDENDEHSGNALHYEGRAADLTTLPVDGTKLGRLGRLAVDAGCDWTFFEDTSHIHVSVKK